MAFRYSTADLVSGTLNGGLMDIYLMAVNWWLTPTAQFAINYRYVILTRFNIVGYSSGINIRLAFILD